MSALLTSDDGGNQQTEIPKLSLYIIERHINLVFFFLQLCD